MLSDVVQGFLVFKFFFQPSILESQPHDRLTSKNHVER
jgi:hypothetical protein